MRSRKWKLYVVHHSHTDIGYTDLQERIIYNHVDYIRSAVKAIKEGYEKDTVTKNFKWNCETYFCVEKFLEQAKEEEKADFFEMVKRGNIGLSATYLNFNDLVDKYVLNKRTAEAVSIFKEQGIVFNTAMNADVNGVSLGTLDVLLDNGIEFFFTNIHCHHGMYPLYQNQKPYFWENEAGKKLLVFSGEHYNLGNVLGLVYDKNVVKVSKDKHLEFIKEKVDAYVKECAEHDYPYDFIPVGLSGVFSDNAPPKPEIASTLEAFNKLYGDEITIEMVTVQELYAKIKDQVKDAPVYKGDLTDWWANGVGTTPYAVKHYKEAQRMYHICRQLDSEGKAIDEKILRDTENNMLLYAEHTWGHSSTITNPYDTMVQNLDIRNISYASKAHEGAAMNFNRITHSRGDKLRYYDRDGKLKVVHVGEVEGLQTVEFYIEAWAYEAVEIEDIQTGKVLVAQVSPHPRGALVTFVDYFASGEEKIYNFKECEKQQEVINTRVAYIGSERIKDIVNTYDPVSYKLPYTLENDFFSISYKIGEGVTSFYNKVEDREMLVGGDAKFFTPIYENTAIRTNVYTERSILGRNIRGKHAKKHIGELTEVKILERGEVFNTIELVFSLEGTFFSSVVIKMYHQLPKIDFKYKIAKTLSMDVESIYLPLALDLPETTRYADKSDAIFRPGIDQIPGTCMEYYLLDNGIVYEGAENSILIATKDAPTIYMGELKHHPIVLCDNKTENNKRPIYSWVMNNTWETNFKMDLSGITEFCYTLNLVPTKAIKQSFEIMKDQAYGCGAFMID